MLQVTFSGKDKPASTLTDLLNCGNAKAQGGGGIVSVTLTDLFNRRNAKGHGGESLLYHANSEQFAPDTTKLGLIL